MKLKWQFEILDPCSEDWSTMKGDERRRYCERCQEVVYDLSTLTAQEVDALSSRERLPCVQVWRWPDGRIEVRDEPALPSHPRLGLRRLVVSAAVAVPLLAAGCDEAPATVGKPVLPEVYEASEGHAAESERRDLRAEPPSRDEADCDEPAVVEEEPEAAAAEKPGPRRTAGRPVPMKVTDPLDPWL
jgi:hypothetical protein